jgi:hypothetical protein
MTWRHMGNKGHNIENIWQRIWGKIKEQMKIKLGRPIEHLGSKTPKPQKSSSSPTLSPSPKSDKIWASSTWMGLAAHLSENNFLTVCCVQHLIFALATATGNLVGTVWSFGWERQTYKDLQMLFELTDCSISQGDIIVKIALSPCLIGFSDDEPLLNHSHHMFWDSLRLNLRPHSCGPSSLSSSNIVEKWALGGWPIHPHKC